jgi:hypothetical protein
MEQSYESDVEIYTAEGQQIWQSHAHTWIAGSRYQFGRFDTGNVQTDPRPPVVAPIALPVRARLPGAVSRGVAKIDALLPADAALGRQDLVLVNVPFKYQCNFASVVRRSEGGVSPRSWRCLGVSADEVAVERPDAHALVLRPAGGYLRHFEDTNVRSRMIPFAAGDRIELPGYAITVRAITADGRPAEVEHRFAVPLEDPSLRWLVWQRGAYRPFTPPPVGGAKVLPADRFAFGDLLEDR